MKQHNLFAEDITDDLNDAYTAKITGPVYEPKNIKPHVLELVDAEKMKRILYEINAADISEEEKQFLRLGAQRHLVFNYSKIADYYAHSGPEVQKLMERSALVIIDFKQAIQYGYVKLSQEVFNQYLTENGK
jgi:hypothetical protein